MVTWAIFQVNLIQSYPQPIVTSILCIRSYIFVVEITSIPFNIDLGNRRKATIISVENNFFIWTLSTRVWGRNPYGARLR